MKTDRWRAFWLRNLQRSAHVHRRCRNDLVCWVGASLMRENLPRLLWSASDAGTKLEGRNARVSARVPRTFVPCSG